MAGQRMQIIPSEVEGVKFGRWTALKCGPNSTAWCRCDCGTEDTVYVPHLIKGKSKSCGCWNSELMKARHAKYWEDKYGMGRSVKRERSIWATMLKRCLNPKASSYPRYGGRGITVCERWLDFKCFLEDMGLRPSEKYSLDRIDNNGNYCRENCRWATAKQQNRNTRTNRMLTYNGETMPVSAWGERYGLLPKLITVRLDVLGWDIEKALLTPPRKDRRRQWDQKPVVNVTVNLNL